MGRVTLLALGACAAGLIAACGGSGGSGSGSRALPAVRLAVTSPVDTQTTRQGTVTVRGTVQPAGAAVQVLGQAAEVVGTTFTAEVALAPGANVIDVAASAPRRAPSLTAVRVTRELLITVPNLVGKSEDDARAAVKALGLDLDVHDAGGFFDALLPGSPGVCDQDPVAGAQVTRGTKVQVSVAKRC
jgi:Glucodextranase, domain B/PASTA domain